MEFPVERYAPTIEVKVYVSGDLTLIKHALSEFVFDGLCVSVLPIDYVYTMGCESGAMLTLINYPRYPTTAEALFRKGVDLAKFMIERLH